MSKNINYCMKEEKRLQTFEWYRTPPTRKYSYMAALYIYCKLL